MALKPADMEYVPPKPNLELVAHYEQTVDNWLLAQEKGKKEYCLAFDIPCPLNESDAQELERRYNAQGWQAAVHLSKNPPFSTLVLKVPQKINYRHDPRCETNPTSVYPSSLNGW